MDKNKNIKKNLAANLKLYHKEFQNLLNIKNLKIFKKTEDKNIIDIKQKNCKQKKRTI